MWNSFPGKNRAAMHFMEVIDFIKEYVQAGLHIEFLKGYKNDPTD